MEFKGYIQACFICNEEYHNVLKADRCKICNTFFKKTNEYFMDSEMSDNPTNIYHYLCEKCEIRLTSESSIMCPKCGSGLISVGWEHTDYKPTFRNYLSQFLP